MKHTYVKKAAALSLSLLMLAAVFSGCSGKENEPKLAARDLTAGVPRGDAAADYDFNVQTETPQAYDKFTQAVSEFSASLLRETEKEGQNTLLSPISAYFTLAMLQNGAQGGTLKEMKNLLGGVVSVDNINACSNYLRQRLTAFSSEDGSLQIANSIWVRGGLDVNRSFLQKNADFFDAGIFSTDFSGPDAAKDMNAWTKHHTNGLIDSIVAKTSGSDALYLLNALYLEDLWANDYKSYNVKDGDFHLADGTKQTASFLHGSERYIRSENAQGYIKNLKTLPCRFVAVLPNEGTSLTDYIAALDETELKTLFDSMTATDFAKVSTPAFSFDFDTSLNKPLQNLGMKQAFTDEADFSKISSSGLVLSDVVQRTRIELGARGVKAGAATKAEVNQSASITDYSVELDRPFLFMIVDNESNLPVFIGALYNPAG